MMALAITAGETPAILENAYPVHYQPRAGRDRTPGERIFMARPTRKFSREFVERLVDFEEEFWKRIKRGKPDECWPWLWHKHRDGYGKLTFCRRTVGAHRCAYVLGVGEISSGMYVLHKCDNRSCCNPNHLFLGTAIDNMADRDAKDRVSRGEKHPFTKLTNKEVLRIRWLRNHTKITLVKLAGMFPLSISRISDICTGKTWRHLL